MRPDKPNRGIFLISINVTGQLTDDLPVEPNEPDGDSDADEGIGCKDFPAVHFQPQPECIQRGLQSDQKNELNNPEELRHGFDNERGIMDELGLLLSERTDRRSENSQAENPCPVSQVDSILLKSRQRNTRSASRILGEERKDFSEVLLVNDFASDRLQFGRLTVEGDGETRRAGHIDVIKIIADKCAFV